MNGDNSFAEGYAIGRDSGTGSNNSAWGGDWAWWIVILLIFGWGNGGWGGGFGGNGARGGGVTDGYVLASDFANIERKIDSTNNGICDGFYAVNTSFGNLNNTIAQNTASIQNTLTQGFAGLNTGMIQQGYENRIATNGVSTQLASCCCDLREGIQANTTQGIMNTNAIQQQISNCCCDVEKQNMQNRFDMAQYNCSTLQAIDKVGDRIIDYLANEKTQSLRDENQTLRLAASQQAQNNYLVSQLRPAPSPAYVVPNPYCNCGYTNNYATSGCGCNC